MWKKWYSNLTLKNKILGLSVIVMILVLISLLITGFNLVVPFAQGYAIEISKGRYDLLDMMILDSRHEMSKKANIIANNPVIIDSLENGSQSGIKIILNKYGDQADILLIVDENGKVLASKNNAGRFGDKTSLADVVKASISKKQESYSYEYLAKDDLLKESNKLYEQVKMTRTKTKGMKEGFVDKEIEEDALANTVITPIIKNNKPIGAVVSAEILNRNYEYVDKVKKGDEGIAATIFKDDLRITTSVPGKNNGRATGTLLSAKVVDKVLINGEKYIGRAIVAGIPMWSYYVPIKNYKNDIVGILFVAMSETKVFDIIKDKFLIGIFISMFISLIAGYTLTVLFSNKLTDPIKDLLDSVKKIENGDLQFEIEESNENDEIGQLQNSVISMKKNLHNLVKELCISTEEISSGLEELNAAADQTAQGAQQVSTSVTQLAAGSQEQANNLNSSLENINTMNRAVQKISENADNTVKLSEQTEKNADSGFNQSEDAVNKINQIKTIATEVSTSINELGKLSTEIEQIVDLIKGIASQTNLLALNAAIEAARAGEHGKGFAVVAEEVKKLAGESATATDKITGMIKEIQNKTNMAVVSMEQAVSEVEDGVGIVENTGKSLMEILKAAKMTSSQITEIYKEVNGLASNSDNVVKMMENISSITEESAASTEEIASISQDQTASFEEISACASSLAKVAEALQKQASIFKV